MSSHKIKAADTLFNNDALIRAASFRLIISQTDTCSFVNNVSTWLLFVVCHIMFDWLPKAHLIISFVFLRHFSEFLRSHYFCKYQIEVLTSGSVFLADILFCESALFYFSEVKTRLRFFVFFLILFYHCNHSVSAYYCCLVRLPTYCILYNDVKDAEYLQRFNKDLNLKNVWACRKVEQSVKSVF